MVQPDRPQMTIWHMCLASWMTKHTHKHTHSQYVILIDFLVTMVT